jgi:hypothetical protein
MNNEWYVKPAASGDLDAIRVTTLPEGPAVLLNLTGSGEFQILSYVETLELAHVLFEAVKALERHALASRN